MAMQGVLAVKQRTQMGSKECRRMRLQGQVPGNLYGHHETPVPLVAATADVTHLIHAGTRVLDVDIDGTTSKALIREVQWDYLGRAIQHFDLVRVDPNEKLTVEVHVELKGTSPGVLGGGVLDHTLRTLTVECLAIQIPDNIPVKVSALEIGQAIHVRDLEIPPNTKILNNPDAVVVRVEKPGSDEVLAAGEEGTAQPEVIGRKAAEDEEAE